jgi:acetolactate synthase small subunit
LTVAVPNAKGVLARLTASIANLGCNIISLVTYGCTPEACLITLKISDVEEGSLRDTLTGLGLELVDLRSA